MTNQADNLNDSDHSKIENDSDNLDFSNPILTSTNNSLSSNNNDVCRDYLRNACRRGANCKFSHPESSDPKKYDIPLLTFCHDFQNRECKRNNCKFVHCSKQEEETYKTTGKLPPNVNYNVNGLNAPSKPNNNNQNNNNNSTNNNSNSHSNNSQNNQQNNSNQSNHNNKFNNKNAQICKDFIKGDCFRGQRCKFRHVKNDQQEQRNFNSNNNSKNNKNHNKNQNKNNGNNYEQSDQFDKQFNNNNNNNFQSNNNQSNFDNRFMVQQQRIDQQQFNQLKPNSISNQINRNDNQFQLSIDRRNMRSIFEPEPKRRAFDTGFNTPTTFTFANNANNQICVTNALNHQMLSNHSNQNPNGTSNSDPTPPTNSVTNCSNAAQSALAAAMAINELNSSNVSTSVTSNTITRSMYSNLNDNRFLLEENNSLRRKIDELKQQVVDLMNANEFLLEQNAQLRSSRLPTTSVNQNVQVSTTLHNSVVASALHTNAVVQPKPTNNQVTASSQGIQSLPHIGTSTISTQQLANQTATDLLVANHLHIQNQQRAVGVASALHTNAVVQPTSSALSTNPLNNPLSAVSSMSSLTSTSTSTPLVSYPIMTGASMTAPIHSLGHLTH